MIHWLSNETFILGYIQHGVVNDNKNQLTHQFIISLLCITRTLGETYFGKVRLRSSLTNCGLPVLTGRAGSLAPTAL